MSADVRFKISDLKNVTASPRPIQSALCNLQSANPITCHFRCVRTVFLKQRVAKIREIETHLFRSENRLKIFSVNQKKRVAGQIRRTIERREGLNWFFAPRVFIIIDLSKRCDSRKKRGPFFMI